jgi:VWFA-related protein
MRALISLFVASSIAVAAQERPPFRARVELVEVDVVAIDGDRRIVGGLTRDDFEVREDGHIVEIKTFVPVVADTATRNEGGRLVVLLLDNLVTSPIWTTRIKSIAHQFADRMGPHDVLGVVQLNGNAGATTTSRRQIDADIDRFTYQGSKIAQDVGKHALDTVASLARQLANVSHRRKTLVCIGTPSVFNPTEPAASGTSYSSNWFDAVKDAARSNVTVYVVDPSGLTAQRPHDAIAFTEETGGEAFSTNEFDKAVNQVWSESGHYYLLGYEPPSLGGKTHRIDVRVKRPGVTVRARRTRS